MLALLFFEPTKNIPLSRLLQLLFALLGMGASQVVLVVKNPPVKGRRQTNVWSLGWEVPLEEAWQPIPVFLPGESPWTEEPGNLWSIGSQRVLDMTEVPYHILLGVTFKIFKYIACLMKNIWKLRGVLIRPWTIWSLIPWNADIDCELSSMQVITKDVEIDETVRERY